MSIQRNDNDFKYTYFFQMHPRVLKNSKNIVMVKRKGGKGSRPMPLPSKAARDFMSKASGVIKTTQGPESPIDVPVNLRMIFYGPWGLDASLPDLSNLYQALEDVFEHEGVLANDSLVSSHDGSRRVRLCPHCHDRDILTRGPNKGKRKKDCGAKKNCPHMGILVVITPAHLEAEEDLLAVQRMRPGDIRVTL